MRFRYAKVGFAQFAESKPLPARHAARLAPAVCYADICCLFAA